MVSKTRALDSKARNKRVIDGYKKTIEDYTNDTEKKERREHCLCKYCKYVSSKIGGASMTTKPCDCCGKKLYFESTYTDDLCIDCAKEYGHCKRCSQKMD